MASRLSNLDDQKPRINIQTEGHTLTPPSSQNGPEDPEAFGSTPSHSPSQSQARKPTPNQPEDSVLFGNTSDLHWRWGSNTTTSSCMAGAHHGRHGLRWQIQPDRSHSDWPRQDHSVLWVAIVRRRIELGKGMRCHVHAVRSHWLGWQTSPTQHQTGKPGWWLAVDHPSHHQRTHSKPRGSGHPHSIPPASTPFNFHNQDSSLWPANLPAAAEWWEVPRLGHWTSTPGVRSGATVRPRSRPGATRVMGGPTPVTFALIRSWIWKWPKFSINFLISVINVWEIGRF